MPDFDPWELFEVVEVNAKKKKRSMCKLCGERWWDIGPAFILLHFGFDPQREVQKKANVRRSTTRPTQFGGRSARCTTRTRCRRRTRRRPPRCKAGSRSSRLRTRHSDRAAWTWSLLVRRDFSRPSIARNEGRLDRAEARAPHR